MSNKEKTECRKADFVSLRLAREDRFRMNHPVLSKGNQLGFAMATQATKSDAPIAKRIVLRIKGMQ